MPTRREFLHHGTTGAAALSTLALPLDLLHAARPDVASTATSDAWDVRWPARLTGRHKAVFDVAEIESGYGVWRASAWAGQYRDVLKATTAQISPVIVLRHNAIVLAMQQSFWDKYSLGKSKSVTHPLTQQPTESNPALLDETTGIPAPFSGSALHKQIARGVVALACDLALQDMIDMVVATGTAEAAARKECIAALVPGVILQPSGVFAAVLAQEAGCAYVRSS